MDSVMYMCKISSVYQDLLDDDEAIVDDVADDDDEELDNIGTYLMASPTRSRIEIRVFHGRFYDPSRASRICTLIHTESTSIFNSYGRFLTTPSPKERTFPSKSIQNNKTDRAMRRGHTYGALGGGLRISIGTLFNWCTLRTRYLIRMGLICRGRCPATRNSN
uniref:Uncharacterized protein n=1 Tax=Solanum tuberosum TaxID=4113 RepID=M1DG30_SOLTU